MKVDSTSKNIKFQ